MTLEAIKNHLKKPEPNWWSEDTWVRWYKELKEMIDPSLDSRLVNYIESCRNPEYKHWSRWVWWFEDLKKIVQISSKSTTE